MQLGVTLQRSWILTDWSTFSFSFLINFWKKNVNCICDKNILFWIQTTTAENAEKVKVFEFQTLPEVKWESVGFKSNMFRYPYKKLNINHYGNSRTSAEDCDRWSSLEIDFLGNCKLLNIIKNIMFFVTNGPVTGLLVTYSARHILWNIKTLILIDFIGMADFVIVVFL